MENEPKKVEEVEQKDTAREMMTLPDGTIADVTGMTPEEKRELLDSYSKN